VAALCAATPALAEPVPLALPAGRLGDAVLALGRQAGVSVAVADAALWGRQVPALRGRYTTRQALEKLARAADAEVEAAGPSGWRLVARRPPGSRWRAAPRRPKPPPPPPASTGPAPPDIIVTGSKRDVPLQEFAGQVTLVEGAELSIGGSGDTDRLMTRVASISSTHLGAGRNKLFIRGIADSSFTGPTQSTVGQYLGDLRLSFNAPDPDLRLSDLASVEVLEGPQGTLYGAGSLGGIIRLVPNAPDFTYLGGSATVGGSTTWHGRPGGDVNAVFNAPLIGDRLAIRIVADAASEGGYIDKPLIGRKDVNRTDIFGGRAALRYKIGNGWTVDLIGLGQKTNGEDSQYADRNGPRLTRASRTAEGFDADYIQGQLVISGKVFGLNLSSSTGIASQQLTERYDATLTNGTPRIFVQNNDTNMIAHETRVWRPVHDGWGWMVAASFTHNHTLLTRQLGAPDVPRPATGVTNRVDEVSIFGEASKDLMPFLTATAGFRVTRSELGGSAEDIRPAQPVTEKERAAITAGRVEMAALPSAALIAHFAAETSLYLRYQQGFRAGGLAVERDFVRRFDNDRAYTVELGARHGKRMTGPFDLAASISYTRWNDIQADFIDGFGLPSTANIGDGRIWSFTANGGIAVMTGLRVEAGVTINDSRVINPLRTLPVGVVIGGGSSATGSGGVSVGGTIDPALLFARMDQVPNIAKFGSRVGFDFMRAIDDHVTLTATGWVRYVGASRLGVGPTLGERQGDYIDTGLAGRLGVGAVGATLSVTNIADSVGNRFALGTPITTGRKQITPLRPRTIRIGFDVAF
ncbi:TonB-dependent receptor, partial [Sphingomonas sp.]|uniref:TonB-dependent receptor n=1 Tax=Sphingomonas sp. TaxID=28214 RepID=UPI002C5A55E9